MDRDAAEPNRKVRIEYHNLPEGKYSKQPKFNCADMKLKAIEFVQLKFSQYRKQDMQDMTLARELKMNFDENFHPTWQCVVGKNYGTEIGFEDGYVIYFYVGPTAILLWKAG